MGIIAIDPGTTKSGVVTIEDDGTVHGDIFDNAHLESYLSDCSYVQTYDQCVCEMIACYGMPVGRETFETCVWIGRFMAAFGPHRCDRLFRGDIKRHLCKSPKAKDPHVWQALLDRYGPGKEIAVGCKKTPGPLYGITSHQRAALAVGVCWLDGVRSKVEIVPVPADGSDGVVL